VSNSYPDSVDSIDDVDGVENVDNVLNVNEQPRQQRHSQDFVATSNINVETSTDVDKTFNDDPSQTLVVRKKQNEYQNFNSGSGSDSGSGLAQLFRFIFSCLVYTFVYNRVL
jgi:hypothetical protein